MQLESTLFGVAVVQIKPALEKLLNLPNDSLTKEIALLQDLMELFIDYQVPSDLISYDGDAHKSGKLGVVKGYVLYSPFIPFSRKTLIFLFRWRR